MGICEELNGNEHFTLTVSGRDVTVWRDSLESWIVYTQPDLNYIGRFTAETRDRATSYVSEVAGYAGTTD